MLAAACATAVGGMGTKTAPPVDAREIPPGIVEHYRFVEAHQALTEQVRCYCGCGRTLDHRFLRDCFVRDDGRFEAHAKDCGTCLAEAAAVKRMEDEGQGSDAIASAIDAEFSASGPPTRGR